MHFILAPANAAAGLAGSIHVFSFHALLVQQLLRPHPWTCRVFAQAHPRVRVEWNVWFVEAYYISSCRGFTT